MIKVTRQQNKVSTVEKCEKCGGFRIWSVYENGMREKVIYSIRGVKCRHKWRLATQKEIGD